MKLKLLSLFTIFSACALLNSQTNFGPKVTIDANTGNAPYAIATGLIDDDAFLDIMVGTLLDNTIIWYKNNGDATFTKQSNTANTIADIGALKLVDLNNDNFLDLLVTAYTSDFVAWYANDGNGNFGVEQIIATINGASGLFVGDIDGDLTPDIAVTSYLDAEVVWFANNGAGNFGLANTIDNTLSFPGSVSMKDIDNDGDLDALVANAAYDGNDVIKIFTNDLVPGGTVSFADDMPTIATGKTGIFNATFEDLDGDANLDILATEVSCGGCVVGNLYWYEDNGTSFTETVFTTSIINPSVAQHRDLDNDGLKDIVLSSGTTGAGNDLVWYKNNGGTYGSEQVIDATSSQAYVYSLADYDADGDLDIASCAYNQDALNYFENLKFTKTNALVLTGVFDGSLTGGTPKGVEIFVTENIPDLSVFGLGSANNGGGTDGQEFTFPAVTATIGQYIYVSSEDAEFENFFGQPADYTTAAMGINGDDAVELFENLVVIDTYGSINTNGDGEVWDYTDGWAYRVNMTGPDGLIFVPSNWFYSGLDELEGGTDNASASTPFPIGSYGNLLSISNVNSTSFRIYPNPAKNILNFKGMTSETLNLKVYDILGQSVLNSSIEQNGSLDISALRDGLYIIKFENTNSTYKFIKH